MVIQRTSDIYRTEALRVGCQEKKLERYPEGLEYYGKEFAFYPQSNWEPFTGFKERNKRLNLHFRMMTLGV